DRPEGRSGRALPPRSNPGRCGCATPAAASAGACAGLDFSVADAPLAQASLASLLFISSSRREHHGAAANAPLVIDHPDPRHNAAAHIRPLRAERLARELPNRLGDAEMAAGGAGLADRQLPARGIERKTSVRLKSVGANESRPLAFPAETQALELQHID